MLGSDEATIKVSAKHAHDLGTVFQIQDDLLDVSLQRWWLWPAGVVGVILGAGYTMPPLRFKSRGLLQLLAYLLLLFVGPMLLIAGVFRQWPGMDVVLAAIAFGAMQTGVLLVNTAEDLDEDEREGIRTAAVVLQARGTIVLAQWAVGLGGLGLAALLLARLPGWSGLAVAPLLGVAAWNVKWLRALVERISPRGEAERREAIRDQGKHVPARIEAGAWAGAFGALAVWLSRLPW